MQITLTPEQESLIQYGIESGRIKSAEDAVQQALDYWVERQRNLIELLMALDEAEEDFRSGNFVECDADDLGGLAEEIKQSVRNKASAAAREV